MVPPQDRETNARLVELLARLADENDIDALLSAFARGEIGKERIVSELAVRYQRGIGSAVQALAEHDAGAAQQLGERLRRRLDEFLAGLAERDGGSVVREVKAPVASDSFRDRDDAVLLREYVILKALSRRNEPLRSAEIFDIVHKLNSSVQEDAVTAHLARLVKAGLIGRERKGRYNAVGAGAVYLSGLVSEIEARGLALPG